MPRVGGRGCVAGHRGRPSGGHRLLEQHLRHLPRAQRELRTTRRCARVRTLVDAAVRGACVDLPQPVSPQRIATCRVARGWPRDSHAVLCCAVLCCVMLCYAMLYAMPCHAMLCCAMLCYAELCCAVLCCAMLCYAMLCHLPRLEHLSHLSR